MASATDSATRRAQNCEDHADDQENDADHQNEVGEREGGEKAGQDEPEHDEDDPKNDHGEPFRRGATAGAQGVCRGWRYPTRHPMEDPLGGFDYTPKAVASHRIDTSIQCPCMTRADVSGHPFQA